MGMRRVRIIQIRPQGECLVSPLLGGGMLRAVTASKAVDPVFFAEDLRNVGRDGIDHGFYARLVQPIGVSPFRDGMRIQQTVGADLLLVALHVIFYSVRIARHC